MYLRWAQIGLLEPKKYLFISLIDGKQPLFIWLTYPFLKIFSDPLIAGRLVSILAGLGTMIILFKMTQFLFEKREAAFFAALIYIVFPFAVLYDRLALYDSLLAFLFIAGIYFQLKAVCDFKIKYAAIAGVFAGLGLLTKSSAIFVLLLSPLTLIFLKKFAKENFFQWAKIIGIIVFIALQISLILYVSPLHGMVKMKNEVFLLTLQEFFTHPFFVVFGNVSGLLSYFPPYFSFVWIFLLVIFVLFSLIDIARLRNISVKNSNQWKIIYLFLLFFIPFTSLSFFAKIIYPRFIFFMTIPLVIILSNALYQIILFINQKIFKVFFIFIFFFLPVLNSFFIIFKPTVASLPLPDSEQLLNSWPSGWGVKETVEYLNERSKTHQIFLGTEGTQGLFPYAFDLYFIGNNNIQVKGYWPVNDIPLNVRQMARTKETYFIYKDTINPQPQKNVKEILRVRRGIGENYLVLLRVFPE